MTVGWKFKDEWAAAHPGDDKAVRSFVRLSSSTFFKLFLFKIFSLPSFTPTNLTHLTMLRHLHTEGRSCVGCAAERGRRGCSASRSGVWGGDRAPSSNST